MRTLRYKKICALALAVAAVAPFAGDANAAGTRTYALADCKTFGGAPLENWSLSKN